MNGANIKILAFTSDRGLLAPESSVALRAKEYGELVGELHFVLLCDEAHGLKASQLGENIWVYPTNSSMALARPFDAAKMGKKIVFARKFVRGKSVITAQDPFECGWAGLRVKKKWRLPLEIQVHTDPFSPYFSGFQNRVRKLFFMNVLKNADRVRCVSGAVADRLKQKVSPNKIVILPILVDKTLGEGTVTFDTHARYSWRFVLLSVARLEPEKNLDSAIKILSLVRQRYPDTGLVIVGQGSQEGHLKSLIKKLGQESNVELAGWQSNLGSYYKTANIFLQTSKFEGYGMALIEAGLSGLPVVTTPVGIAEELQSGKDLYVCEHDDIESFAAAICDLMENNFKRENMKLNLKRTLEEKLVSKEEYLGELVKGWEECANFVHA